MDQINGEMTSREDQEMLNRLRAVLPPIYENAWPSAGIIDGSRICLDLEWDEDTGALEIIGFGNEKWVCQWAWQTLNEQSRERLRKALLSTLASTVVIIQNADGDIRKLRANAFRISGPADFLKLEDPMLAHAVLHSEEDHDLGYLNATMGPLPNYKHLRKIAPREYNAADVVSTCMVWDVLAEELIADIQAERTYRTQRLPFIWLAIESEEAGVAVCPTTPVPLYEKFDGKRRQARMLLQAYTGWPANINSPDDMKHVLYNLERLPIQRDNTGAAYWEEEKATADKNAIATLRRHVETEWDESESPTMEQAWENIEAGGNSALEARYLFMGAQQAVSHYVLPCCVTEGEKDKKRVVGVRTRIYPELRQHVQASGRHSYVGPALQQMKGELLTLIQPDASTCWVGHDWKQIEVRILAFEARDESYLQAFREGKDIHSINTRDIFGAVGNKELEELRRRFIKAFVFRLHYQGKPENAGDIPGTRALGLNADGLVDASERYLAKHPALPVYWARIAAEAERTGMVRTFMGTPRRLTSPWKNARAREACNHPMQGGVADIYSTTALLVKATAPWARLVFGAHDAQWWQVPISRRLEFLARYAPIVEREFTINGQQVSFPADYKFKDVAA